MTFTLSGHSQSLLSAVSPDLRRVVIHAIQVTALDFAVSEGWRSSQDQMKDWLKGRSRFNGIPVGQTQGGIAGTGLGNHQSGRAVDLVPLVNGLPDYSDWSNFYPLADAMRTAALAESVTIRWGGVWDRLLNNLPAGPVPLELARNDYAKRHGGHALLDGPHFELV